MGILQGLFEWLPISSEGQLVFIATSVFDIPEHVAISLAFWLHLGTLIAVLVVFRSLWKEILTVRNEETIPYQILLFYSTLGTAIIGIPLRLFLYSFIHNSTSKIITLVIGFSLIITGVLLYQSKKIDGITDITLMTPKKALLIGIAQGFSIIPGISRSGITITSLVFLRFNLETSFKSSFIISVPAVLGAIILDIFFSILDGNSLFSELSFYGIMVSIFFASITGFLTMKYFIKIAQQYNFVIVTCLLGVFIIAYSLIF
ncbi:MAG: undecaprenyl-diphosphate phosphatase [Candidatus Heimdallarchaeota archaeon]|nr:undecaprenyl-diphosphate phosphatase [Candidatus Heimdallarchaeota archaeon]